MLRILLDIAAQVLKHVCLASHSQAILRAQEYAGLQQGLELGPVPIAWLPVYLDGGRLHGLHNMRAQTLTQLQRSQCAPTCNSQAAVLNRVCSEELETNLSYGGRQGTAEGKLSTKCVHIGGWQGQSSMPTRQQLWKKDAAVAQAEGKPRHHGISKDSCMP